jgi:HAE1 family hydrophobic/amphiphilic exporter-1
MPRRRSDRRADVIEEIVRRPVSVVVATLAVCALGVFSLFKLPLALLPTVERPSLVITAVAPASSRDEMLHDVTEPIERRLPSVAGITSIESETTDGESRITVGSAWQTDADRLRIDVARRIEGAAGIALDELRVDTAGADVLPVIEVAVTGASGATRTRIAQRVLLPELARIEGAGKIEIVGATPLRVTVEPVAAAVAARGLTAADVEERLQGVGRTSAAGALREGASIRPLVMTQPARSLGDLRALLVKGVPLGEVAVVGLREIGDESEFRSASGAGRAERGVLLRVHRAPRANAVALARAVHARIDDLGPRMRNVRLLVVADRSGEVSRALGELALAVLIGVLLGTIVLRWILGHWRPTLALAVVVPVALLASFTAFYAAGIPLDVISLAGLALATGLLVDNSIVVLESIETTGSVVGGTRQILLAVVASSITLVVVFAPLLYLRGLARAIFAEQAIAVVASVAASLVLSLTLTPVLAARSASGGSRNPGVERYLALLQRALASPRRAITVAVLMTLVAIGTGWLLPRELFARGASKQVTVELPARLHFDLWRAIGRHVRGAVKTSMTTTKELQTANVDFATPRAAREGAAALRKVLPGAAIRVRPSAFIEAVGGDADRVELVASAPTEAEAAALAKRLGGRAPDARASNNALFIRWDEQRLAVNGVDRRAVEHEVRAALGDLDAGRADIGVAEAEIRLLPARGVIPVRMKDAVVPLGAVAGMRMGERSPVVYHDDGRPARRLLFDGNAALPSLETTGAERIRVAGHARELADAYAQLRLAAILALVLLYLTVAAFYESLLLPLLVMAALPFAAGGGLMALLLTGQSLNVMSMIGLIFLGGVVVNHTVVLIDRAEQLRRAGADELEAVRRAAADRYRPVMMTTITAILGMLPLAILGGDGVELRRAVAVVVIGGLVTATAGTLLLIPLLHRAIEPLRSRSRMARAPEARVEAVT